MDSISMDTMNEVYKEGDNDFYNQYNKKKKCCMTIKVITVILCISGFVCNSFIIFKQYIAEETVTSNNIEDNLELQFPSLTLCGCHGFKEENNNLSNFELERYINNTINLDDIIYCVQDQYSVCLKCNCSGKPLLDLESEKWKLSTTYSAYRGRCYTIEYHRKVNRK